MSSPARRRRTAAPEPGSTGSSSSAIRTARSAIRFRHALIRDVAYEGLPFRRRRVLHGRAGDALLRSLDDPSPWSTCSLCTITRRAARPRRGSTPGRPETAPGVVPPPSRRPGSTAGRWTPPASPDVPAVDRADVGERLGDVWNSRSLRRRRPCVRAARPAVQDDELRLVSLLEEGWLRERSGRYSSALSWYTRALRRLGDGDDDAAAAMRAQLTASHGAAARAVTPRARRSCSRPRRRPSGSRRGDPGAHVLPPDWALTDLGRPEAAEYRGKALPIYERLGDLTGRQACSTTSGSTPTTRVGGTWPASSTSGPATCAGDPATSWSTAPRSTTSARSSSDQGPYADAESLFRDALRIADSAGHRLISAVSRGKI